jgi:hypothetical protein
VVEGTPQSAALTFGTTHSVTLPSGIVTGELLLLAFANDGDATATATGWTEAVSAGSESAVRLTVLKRIADGSEGAAVSVTTSASERNAFRVYRISRPSGGLSLSSVEGAITTGSGTSADPPSLTPTWGTQQTLWFAFAAKDDGTSGRALTAFPTDFVSTGTVEDNNAQGVCLAWATRTATAASQNPTAFTTGTGDSWVACTLGVGP